MVDIDSHIRRLDGLDETHPQSALTGVLAAVADFNGDMSAGQDAFMMAGIPDRLQDWLDKLVDKTQAIVNELKEVASFTISVGTPFNVSVAVTFAKPTT